MRSPASAAQPTAPHVLSTGSDSREAADLIDMARGIWKSRAVYAAARLNLADYIADHQSSCDELAHRTGTHPASLHRLLRALASCGLLTENRPGHFALTPIGAALKTGAPGAARATILTIAGDWQWKAWDAFLYSLQTGEPAMRKVFGSNLFDYLTANPQASADFNEAMIGIHGSDGAAMVAAYDFSPFNTLVDLGGGSGTLLTTILQSNTHSRGILFDLPETLPQARRLVEARGLTDRCDVIAGDFFKEVPPNHDVYILAHVLHDWTDAQALPLLRNCRKAIPSHGRLLIVEFVLPQGDTPHPAKLMDLLMLTVTGGVERTAEEFAALLAQANFTIANFIPTSNQQHVVEALPC
jgi:O-methyltransferase domain/Dimerisation domain